MGRAKRPATGVLEHEVNFLESILQANDGKAISKIAKQLGVPEEAANKAAAVIAPALAKGLQKNASKSGGLESLLGALKSGKHERYVDEPDSLESEDSVADGNKILGHILGSKDVSRNVAGSAAQQTGLDAATLKKMLPMLGAVAMGALSKQTKGGGALSGLTGGGGSGGGGLLGGLAGMAGGQGGAASGGAGALGALSSFLDADKDGSPTDDLLNLAKKYF